MKDEALAAPVQDLPFGVGGGLVAIKTLLSRDPCVHANTAIEMIDAILKEHTAAQTAPVEPDWKAEYLKSVESGCITLDELREARAELDATNRQVEILSDALAESQREVAALKAVQEPVAWMQSDEVHISLWKDDYHTIPLYTTPPAAQRQWVGLTDEQRKEIRFQFNGVEQIQINTEAKLKEKNT
jgi:hypothetical protein